MQFKPITVIAVLLLVVASLLVSGCTTSTDTSSSSSGNGGTVSSSDTSQSVTNTLQQAGFIIVTPFSKSTNQYGNVVYKGVIKDGESTLQPYNHNVTVELIKTRNGTLQRFNQSITQAQSNGISKIQGDDTYWYGNDRSNTSYPNKGVKIQIKEPSSNGFTIYGPNKGTVNFGDQNAYLVTVDYMTK
jgi:hypothetical protein